MGSRDDFRLGLEDIWGICDLAESQIESGETAQLSLANAGCRAGLVLLCGYFEGFVRSLVEEALEEVNDRKVDVSRIPDPLFCGVMTAISAKPEKNGVNFLEAFKDSIRHGKAHKIPPKAFSNLEGNPSVDRVEKVFRLFGIMNVLDVLSIKDFGVVSTFKPDSQVEPIRGAIVEILSAAGVPGAADEVLAAVEKKWSPKLKRRKVGYIASIEQLLQKRNIIAHGEGRPEVTPKELRDAATDLQRLGDGLSSELELVLSAIWPVAKAYPSSIERWDYLQITE